MSFGVAWMVQVVPFQTSASVRNAPPVENWPTASHAVADVQETPLSWLLVAPDGIGVVWMVQFVPSQRSASSPLPVSPTASHAVADVHEMLVSDPLPGMFTSAHVVPLRCSAIRVPPARPVFPTAMHEVGDVQDTALSCQSAAPCRTGVPCSSQLAVAGWAIISSTGTAAAAASTRRLIAIVKLP